MGYIPSLPLLGRWLESLVFILGFGFFACLFVCFNLPLYLEGRGWGRG